MGDVDQHIQVQLDYGRAITSGLQVVAVTVDQCTERCAYPFTLLGTFIPNLKAITL